MNNLQDAPEVRGPQDDADAVVDLSNYSQSQDFGYGEDVSQSIPVDTEGAQPTGEREESAEEDWEHKYKVIKGKYDKEVPRLHKEIKSLKREKNDLLRRISLLESVIAQMQSSQPQRASEHVQQAQEDDEELELLKKEYPEVYKAVSKLLDKKLRTVEDNVKRYSASVAEQAFYSQLDALVPQWRELNTDPDFLDWLQEDEGDTGFTRHQLMLMAFDRRDANGVARWFRKYLNSLNSSNGSEPPAMRNISPQSRKTSADTKATSKRFFKESEVKEFYKLAALNKISPEEKARVEKEILQAIMEDRILYGR